MKLSIIVPVLNEEENLSKLAGQLQSIKNQGHEVIIVDGGSVDNTLTIAHEVTDAIVV